MLLELLARPARRGALVRRGHGMHTRPVVTGPVKQGGLHLPWGGEREKGPEVCKKTSIWNLLRYFWNKIFSKYNHHTRLLARHHPRSPRRPCHSGKLAADHAASPDGRGRNMGRHGHRDDALAERCTQRYGKTRVEEMRGWKALCEWTRRPRLSCELVITRV